MTDLELLQYAAVPRFSTTLQGEMSMQNFQSTNPQEEIFELDVPF